MDPIKTALTPEEAWKPLPDKEWSEENAKHLLRRAGFTATPENIGLASKLGLAKTLNYLFQKPPPLKEPLSITKLRNGRADFRRRLRDADRAEKRQIRRQLREKERKAYDDYAIRWLFQVANPRYSAYEKFVMFLQDIVVVSAIKVKDPVDLFDYQAMIRSLAFTEYPKLIRTVSHMPAMIHYLDLQQNRKGSPNENFAREVMELFTLGEGNYTEHDIKEAARALTGIRMRGDEPVFDRRWHDEGTKTIFGHTGNYDGDEFIDLIFTRDAATRFVPGELCRYYLTSEQSIPPPYLEALGKLWKADRFATGRLAEIFFSSRLFYEKQFHGQLIKSPTQFYCGLLQDFGLSVSPFPRITLNFLRQMGQPFYMPPNVRGWVGGRFWIDASTLNARRQLIDYHFTKLDEDKLNADEIVELVALRAEGPAHLWVSNEQLANLIKLPDDQVADALVKILLPADPGPAFRKIVAQQLQNAGQQHRTERLRAITATVLQSPEYQLC